VAFLNNGFLKKHRALADVSGKLESSMFDESFGRYELSQSFSFSQVQWESAQKCIDSVLYSSNIFGREYACDRRWNLGIF